MFSIGYCAEVMVLRENKVGFSSELLSLDNMVNFLKVQYVFPILLRTDC